MFFHRGPAVDEPIYNDEVADCSNENIIGNSSDAAKENISSRTTQPVPGNAFVDNCPAAKECPCMHDKPFLHVIAPGFAEDGTGATKTAWKKRYVW
jgi:hypothetical protein